MTTLSLPLQVSSVFARTGFDDPREVERILSRGAGIGGAAAALAMVLERVTQTNSAGALPLAAATGTLLFVLPRHSKVLMALLLLSAITLGAVVDARSRELPWFMALALSIALALEPVSWKRRLASFIAPLAATAWTLFVVRWLGARHLGSGALATFPAQLASGLFVSVAVALSALNFAVDAVEQKLRVVPRVANAWTRLRAAIEKLADDGVRAKLDASALAVAERWLSAHGEQVEASGATEPQRVAAQEVVDSLLTRIAETKDEELIDHLKQSLRVHRDTLEQFDVLKRRSERAEARAMAEASWLDTAATTLELTPANAGSQRDAADRLSGLATRAIKASAS